MTANKTEREEVETVTTDQNEAGYAEKQDPSGRGLDDALPFAMGAEEDSWTDEEERRVLRKIDFVVVPLVWKASLSPS